MSAIFWQKNCIQQETIAYGLLVTVFCEKTADVVVSCHNNPIDDMKYSRTFVVNKTAKLDLPDCTLGKSPEVSLRSIKTRDEEETEIGWECAYL